MYVKALALLLLLSLLSAGLWKFWDAAGDARENRIVREQSEARIKHLAKVEPQIQKDRIVYRDRIQKIREVVHQCVIPDDLIGLLRESRVFIGG
jgi:hypothetical protein